MTMSREQMKKINDNFQKNVSFVMENIDLTKILDGLRCDYVDSLSPNANPDYAGYMQEIVKIVTSYKAIADICNEIQRMRLDDTEEAKTQEQLNEWQEAINSFQSRRQFIMDIQKQSSFFNNMEV